MFKIGEFSRLTRVSVRMLRYYDEAGLLSPAQKDPWTGYRYYSAGQIPALRRILFLRDLGCTVSEITQALARWEPAAMARLLEQKRGEAQAALEEQREKLRRIQGALEELESGEEAAGCSISIGPVPAYLVFSLRRVVPDYYAEGELWREMAAYARQHRIPVAQNTFTIYHDADYREREVDIEVCAPVAAPGESAGGFCYRTVPAVAAMASTMVGGTFENIAGAYRAFAGWVEAHPRYRMEGENRQVVHRGPWNAQSPADYLTEIQIPLKAL